MSRHNLIGRGNSLSIEDAKDSDFKGAINCDLGILAEHIC